MENPQQQTPTAEQINSQHVLQALDRLKQALDYFRVQAARLQFSADAQAWVFDELTDLAAEFAPKEQS